LQAADTGQNPLGHTGPVWHGIALDGHRRLGQATSADGHCSVAVGVGQIV
jgi:hypothetical protein